MSKRFKGKTCVYCKVRPSTTTGDHVFAREFFINVRRGNLPKVPACEECNNRKSRLEHYLTAVLPFGGRHTDSLENLSTLVAPRLAKNVRLHHELSAGMGRVWNRESGIIVPAQTLPIDSEKIAQLFGFITRGLLFHHWTVTLEPGRHGLWSGFLSPEGVQLHRSFFALNSSASLHVSVGEGTFTYDAVQGTDIPEMTMWLFTMYGGIKLSGDPRRPNEECSIIGAVTATRGALEKFLQLVDAEI